MDNIKVRSILMGQDGLGVEGARSVGELLQKNRALKTIYLGCNNFGEQGAALLSEGVKVNHILEGIWIKRNHIGAAGAFAIANSITNNHSITTLDLEQNELGIEGAIKLAEALRENITVRHLYLGGNNFQEKGTEAIAELLYTNNSIQTLSLACNKIKNEGCVTLANALMRNSSIQTLNLSSNEISDVGAVNIAQVLKKPNCTITNLNLGYAIATRILNLRSNLIGNMGAKAICEALKENFSIRILDLEKNRFNVKTAQYLVSTIRDFNHQIISVRLGINKVYNLIRSPLAEVLKRNVSEFQPTELEIETRQELVDIRSSFRTLKQSAATKPKNLLVQVPFDENDPKNKLKILAKRIRKLKKKVKEYEDSFNSDKGKTVKEEVQNLESQYKTIQNDLTQQRKQKVKVAVTTTETIKTAPTEVANVAQ